jgi:hypothetical protein
MLELLHFSVGENNEAIFTILTDAEMKNVHDDSL